MTYKMSGKAKRGKNAPRHVEHNQHGTEKKPFGSQPSKEELLARMKAVAKAKNIGK